MAPDARASQPLISSALASSTSPARRSTRARSSNGSAAQLFCASTARTAAVCTSSGVALPTSPSDSPVAGSTAPYVPPLPSLPAPVQTLPCQAPSSSSPMSCSPVRSVGHREDGLEHVATGAGLEGLVDVLQVVEADQAVEREPPLPVQFDQGADQRLTATAAAERADDPLPPQRGEVIQ